MIFKYGSHAHAQDEVSLVRFMVLPRRSSRGFRTEIEYRMDITGELLGTSTSDLTTKINTLIAAYQDDDKDAGLFLNDGTTATPHFLQTNHSQNLTGNVIRYRNWNHGGDGAEYATKRTFAIGISALFRDNVNQLTDYRDNISRRAFGPRYRWVESPTQLPYPIRSNLYTTQYIYQYGYATALDAYPLPPPPLLPEPNYLPDLTRIDERGPSRYAKGFRGYTTKWSYVYAVAAPTLLSPTIR